MRTSQRVGTAMLAAALLASSGCYGPFNLTRRLYNWNGQAAQGKWEKELIFLVLAYVPVYGLAIFGDAIIFNSMEFWTGKNPVDAPGKRSDAPRTTRIARGSAEALLTYTPTSDGAELLVQQFQQGRPAGSLRLQRRDGMTVGYDADGRVLFTAQSLANGGVVVNNGNGKRLASYSADQVERLLESKHQ